MTGSANSGHAVTSLARRVAAAYLPDVVGDGLLPPMQSLGRIYPMFGAVFSDSAARRRDEAALADGTLVDLGIGSYFPTDERVIEAAVTALRNGATRYLDSTPLKAAIAAKYGDEQSVTVDLTEVLLLGGARPGIMLAMLALVDEGREVVVPDPDYLGLAHAAAVVGGHVVRPAMRRLDDGSLVPDLDALVDNIGERTAVVAITNPGNPTGHVWSRAELDAVADAARHHGATMVVNEVYDRLVLDPAVAHVGALALGEREGVVVIGGVSKAYDMTGFHLGWIVADAGLVAALSDLRFLAHQAEPSAASQHAALAALTPPVRDEIPKSGCARLAHNAAAVTGALADIGSIRCPTPAAGQFAFPYVGGDDQALAEALKTDAGVCVVPGSAWGRMGRGHLRLALANRAEIQTEGLARLRSGLRRHRGQAGATG